MKIKNLCVRLDNNSLKSNREQLETLSFNVSSGMVKDDRRKNVTEKHRRGDKNSVVSRSTKKVDNTKYIASMQNG